MNWHLSQRYGRVTLVNGIPCFDTCQLTIIWMSIIKMNTGYRLPHWLENLTFHISLRVGRADGQAYGHVRPRMDRLPNFLRYGAAL